MATEPKVITIQNPAKTFFKASGATIAALLGLIFVGVQWGKELIDLSFVSEATYASDIVRMESRVNEHENIIGERMDALTVAQQQNAMAVGTLADDFTTMTRNFAIADAVDLYNSAEDAVYEHKRDMARDGVTQSSRARADELERRLMAAKEYRACVLHNEENCSALRPR